MLIVGSWLLLLSLVVAFHVFPVVMEVFFQEDFLQSHTKVRNGAYIICKSSDFFWVVVEIESRKRQSHKCGNLEKLETVSSSRHRNTTKK